MRKIFPYIAAFIVAVLILFIGLKGFAQTNTVDTNGWTMAEPHDPTLPPPPAAPPDMPSTLPPAPTEGTNSIPTNRVMVVTRNVYIYDCETVTNADRTVTWIQYATVTNTVPKPKDTLIFEVAYKTDLTNETWTHTGVEVRVPMEMFGGSNMFFTTIGNFE